MTSAVFEPVAELLPVALRDTARTVVALRRENRQSIASLREDCDAQVAMLRDELQRRGHPRDVIDDALYAQCALLDEAALKSLEASEHDEWERAPLQVRIFGRNDAGEELLRRIAKRLREPRPNLALLGIFDAVLELGFTGRFAVNGAEPRDKLVREIQERLARAGNGVAGAQARDASAPLIVNPSRPRRRRPSLMAWVLIACVAAAVVWLAIDRWLLSSIAAMAR